MEYGDDRFDYREWVRAVEAATSCEERRWRRVLRWHLKPSWETVDAHGNRLSCRFSSSDSSSLTEDNFESVGSSSSTPSDRASTESRAGDTVSDTEANETDYELHGPDVPTEAQLEHAIKVLLDSDNIMREPASSRAVRHCCTNILGDAVRIASMYVPPPRPSADDSESGAGVDDTMLLLRGAGPMMDPSEATPEHETLRPCSGHEPFPSYQPGAASRPTDAPDAPTVSDHHRNSGGDSGLSAYASGREQQFRLWSEEITAFRDAAELADLTMAEGEALALALERYEERMHRLLEALQEHDSGQAASLAGE
jgi:hypothetical protein